VSGTNSEEDCPRCGGIGTLMAYSDYKPHDYVCGVCLSCGFQYWTQRGILNKAELKEAREDYDYVVLKAHKTKKREEMIKEFDKLYGLKSKRR